MISLRLPAELEVKINSLARVEGRSRSEIVKESIVEYIERHTEMLTPYELGKDLFGKSGSGKGDLSINRKAHLKNLLKAKHAGR
jgi:RHH-type transcriptional regulator, rel operon repressor / antitoxin RelB